MDSIMHSLSTCTQTADEIAKLKAMVEIFKHPKDLAIKIATDLRINGQQIIQEVSAGVDDYHQAHFYEAGYDMGEAVAKTVLGGTKMPNTFNDNVASILKGTTEAFGANFPQADILTCVAKVEEHWIQDLAANVELILGGIYDASIYWFVVGIAAVFQDIGNMALGLPYCLKNWNTSSWDYQGYNKALQVSKDPTHYFKVLTNDVLIGGFSILKDGKAAASAFIAKDYETFGKKFGAIMKLVENVKQDENLFLY